MPVRCGRPGPPLLGVPVGFVSSDGNSTLRLVESGLGISPSRVQAVRWISAGAEGSFTPLAHNLVTLGRDEQAGIRLEAAGVSRHHAEFVRQGPVYALKDCGSTNGTYVNGRRIQHGALSPGDVLRFGDVIGVVVRCDAETALTQPDVCEVTPGVVFGPGLSVELAELRRVAPSDLPVVVVGETGTGKECIARAVHALSGRSGQLHAVNCAALPNALAEAELFGYRKGAFTGAEQPALGHLRAADRGTLFLDELADLPISQQAKLLRVLQDRKVTALGETCPTALDVRFVAAVQEPLSALVKAQRLREDLAMRLNGLVVHLPPLRERRADIGVLLGYFLKQHSGGRPPALEPRLLEDLLLYAWPGNVRELELTVRKLLVLHGHEPRLRRSMLPESMRTQATPPEPVRGPAEGERREHDLSRLVRELKSNGQNVARAAEAIGVSRQRAYRLLDGRSVTELIASQEFDAVEGR
jgi:sigma-54 dependent transcriptional regulator, acetoin dehydrogenase operon transcriptional activator AcoR